MSEKISHRYGDRASYIQSNPSSPQQGNNSSSTKVNWDQQEFGDDDDDVTFRAVRRNKPLSDGMMSFLNALGIH